MSTLSELSCVLKALESMIVEEEVVKRHLYLMHRVETLLVHRSMCESMKDVPTRVKYDVLFTCTTLEALNPSIYSKQPIILRLKNLTRRSKYKEIQSIVTSIRHVVFSRAFKRGKSHNKPPIETVVIVSEDANT